VSQQEPPAQSKFNPETRRVYRRQRRWRIYGPVIGIGVGMALLMLFLLIAFGASRQPRLSIIADSLLCCFTLTPCILVVMLIAGFNLLLAVGMGQVNGYLPRPFRRLQNATAGLGARATQLVRVLAAGVIDFSLRLERWEHQANGWFGMRRKRDAIDSSEERKA
jgi:hypothetical protein